MLRPGLLLLLAVLLATPADAQRRRDRDRDDAFARKGDAALTFSVDGFVEHPFEGGIGGRFWVSDRTVVATSLGFSVESGDYDDTRWGTRFSLGAERHIAGTRRVSPYLGLGASVAYRERSSERVYYPEVPPCYEGEPCPDYYPYPYPYYSGANEMELRVAGQLGAEVRLVEGVTASLAHTLGVTYTRSTDDVLYYDTPVSCDGCEGGIVWPGPYPYDSTYERVRVGTGLTALTFSIYF